MNLRDSKLTDKERIKYLRDILLKANKEYYSGNDCIMSDYAYDVYMEELKKLEKKHPEEYDENSPSKIIGC